jgi:nucleoid-associated protein YgaU
MALSNLFKLEKLQINVYKDSARQKSIATFRLMFNPESYSLSYKNVYSTRQGINTSGRAADYIFGKPAQFSLKIIIDGTGVTEIGLAPGIDVQGQVDQFLKLAANMDGNIHEPRFLVVKWGKLAFPCRLEQTQITYTLFDNSGLPLRAELDTLFLHDQDDAARLRAEGKNSPDLTHVRIVQAHQTLPLLCEEIYGSPGYYLQVAAANGLDNFRQLRPGQRLVFPPLEK